MGTHLKGISRTWRTKGIEDYLQMIAEIVITHVDRFVTLFMTTQCTGRIARIRSLGVPVSRYVTAIKSARGRKRALSSVSAY